MTLSNITATTPIMSSGGHSLPTYVMWVPYVGLGFLFLLVLLFSFRRHHQRLVKSKQYQFEYQEANLSVRKPRISGKIVHFDDIYSAEGPEEPSNRMSSVAAEYPVNSDDVNFELMSATSYSKQYVSTPDLNSQRRVMKHISEDEYFRRKGPREPFSFKSSSEYQLSPLRHRHRVCDLNQARTLWIKSDLENQTKSVAVKYIKVFDLDLCNSCRHHVEKVEGVGSNVGPTSNDGHYSNFDRENGSNDGHYSNFERDNELKFADDDSELTMTSDNTRLNCPDSANVSDEVVSDIPDIYNVSHEMDTSIDSPHYTQPEISIAEVHNPPPSNNEEIGHFEKDTISNGIQLSPLDVTRARSSPDLSPRETTPSDYFVQGIQDSAFKMRTKFGAQPRRDVTGTMQRRTQPRDRSGVFWLDLEGHHQQTQV